MLSIQFEEEKKDRKKSKCVGKRKKGERTLEEDVTEGEDTQRRTKSVMAGERLWWNGE